MKLVHHSMDFQTGETNFQHCVIFQGSIVYNLINLWMDNPGSSE